MKNIYKTYKISKELTPDMKYAIEQLTANQEGFGSFLVDASNFFKKKIDAIRGVFGLNSKNDTKEISKESSKLYKDLQSYDKLVKTIGSKQDKYDAVSSIIVPWIPGVKSDLYTLVTGLKSNVSGIYDNGLVYLEEADTFLAKLLGDEEYATSVIPNKELLSKLSSYKDGTTKYLTDVIDGRTLMDNRELKDVIPNFSSVEVIHNSFKDMIVAKELENVQQVFNKAESLANRAKELYNRVQSKDFTISTVRAKEMGPLLQDSAAIVTNIGAIVRLLDAGVTVHKAILQKLDKLI